MEDIAIYETTHMKGVESFQKMLNANPDKASIGVNKMANNSLFLPIAFVERTLDELYQGLWQTTNFRWQVVANEIIGSIDLQVYHPAAKVWITRTGAASAMIQIGRDKPLHVDNKIKNTLVKDFPHLKAECLKNAAKSLGTVFGRNLNRGTDLEFNYLSDQVQTQVVGSEEAYKLLETATLTDNERTQIDAKISRATARTIKDIINFLNQKQS
jgi:hypothetical protein